LNDPTPASGLIILRASRLEALIAPLQRLLDETRPAHPLAPQTVIAAHPGMKQWLTGALAREVGAARIVANLEIQLPSTWLDGLSTTLLGERAVALPKFRRGHLRWSVHALLAEPGRHGISDPRLLGYLQAEGAADLRALRRFQLADRLTRVLTQYLVYRSDWLEAWEAGKSSWATGRLSDPALRALESQALAPLWKALVDELGDHRGRLVKAVIDALRAPVQPLPPLHVFGLSHLPPAELAVLRAYARHALVSIYVPDPCREYWGGLHSGRAQGDWREPDTEAWSRFRDEEQARFDDPDALDWREQGHPLLARWGRLGQHFFAALTEGPVREDIRHWKDEQEAAPGNRLQRLQESLRCLRPELMQEDPTAPDARADASLRIHACHTRLRELEVLRDALLDAIERDAVRPGEMVVMAPDIRAYLPLIPAVFGEPGSARERLLPYHLADVPVARSHPLFTTFETLLGLGASRLTAPEVVDLLGVAELRRALGLGISEADELIEWLRASRVAWALDGEHKAALQLPARPEHSFAWAMDRMLAGYLMADSGHDEGAQTVHLEDGTELLPLGGIQGPGAVALGALDRLLCELQAWRALAEVEQPASAWAEQLRARVDALLRIDPTDADARAALSVVHRAIAQLAAEPAHNGMDPPLRLAVVRELLQDALAGAPERQRFLMGGITFCGMVPQRAIPFGVVCVLGLDEGEFPRHPAHGGLDLMARLRRLGDRDVPGDDRYLFLETVMAARKRLHLSYIGQGARDGKHRNPAAPLAELLAELDLRAGLKPDDGNSPRPWLLRHPLQPFDARYFDGADKALFSYSPAFAGMRGDGSQPLPRLRDGEALAPEPLPEPLPLRALEGWFKDPAKALLADHLQLSLDALDADERLADSEPMDGIAPLHTVARRVFLQHVLPRQCADPDWAWDGQQPDWLRHGGILPLGDAGVAAWDAEVNAVNKLSEVAKATGRFDARAGDGGQAVRIDVALGAGAESADAPLRITGLVRNVFPLGGSEAGLQVVFAFPKAKDAKGLKSADDLNFRDRVPAFLHWALLRLQHAGDAKPVRLTLLAKCKQDSPGEADVFVEPDLAAQANAWDALYCDAKAGMRADMESDLRHRMQGLVDLWASGRLGAGCFYPRAGWSALQALHPKPPRRPKGKGKGGARSDQNDADNLPSAEDIPEDQRLRMERAAVVKVASGAWVAANENYVGERDQAPGYARLLEGDLQFGNPDTDQEGQALVGLLESARRINELILMGDLPAGPSASPEEQTA